METLLHLSSLILCLIFLLFAIKLFKKLWWRPISIQSMMRSQGIKGPSYKFFHGNSKEIISMSSSVKPMELSHSHSLLQVVMPHLYSWMKIYGPIFLYWHGSEARLVITEPDMIKEILSNRDEAFPKREFDAYVKKFLGDGIVITRIQEKWFRLRKLSNHAFNANCLKGMIPAMIASVDMMLETWENGGYKDLDVSEEFKVLTSEIISRTAFGSSYLEGQNIFDKLKQLTVIFDRNKFKVNIPGIGYFIKNKDDIESDELEQEMQGLIINMIKKREEVAISEKSDSFGSDFLGVLLKEHHKNDANTKRLSIQDLIDECKSFYVAGQETTASALTWIVFLLALHTDWQHRARKEVLELFGRRTPTPNDLPRMKIVGMIINEALRLYPPVTFIQREVKREVRLGRFIVPANIILEIPIQAVHQDPEIWGEEADVFKPERFAEGVEKATKGNINAYLPFSLGPRNCAGANFANTEIKIALSMILQKYEFSLSPTYVHSPVHFVMLRPQHGVQIILHPI